MPQHNVNLEVRKVTLSIFLLPPCSGTSMGIGGVLAHNVVILFFL